MFTATISKQIKKQKQKSESPSSYQSYFPKAARLVCVLKYQNKINESIHYF